MAQLVPIPNSLWDAFRAPVDAAQVQRQQDEQRARQEAEQRRRRNTMIGGAVAGAAGGLLLAPALGLTGAAATIGSDAATATNFAIPATSGLLGTGGGIAGFSGLGALTAGLTGASMGANLAGGIESGNIAGALGTAAQGAQSLLMAQDDQRMYGYQPTHQEKALIAHAALQAGTNIGDLSRSAMTGGTTVLHELNRVQSARMDDAQLEKMLLDRNMPFTPKMARDYSAAAGMPLGDWIGQTYQQQQIQQQHQAVQQAQAIELGKLQTENDFNLSRMGFEPVPDHAAIAAIQKTAQGVDTELQSGIITPAEAITLRTQLRQPLQQAMRGELRPHQPTPQEFFAKGQIPGTNTAMVPNGSGGWTVVHGSDTPPNPVGDPQVPQAERASGIVTYHRTPTGQPVPLYFGPNTVTDPDGTQHQYIVNPDEKNGFKVERVSEPHVNQQKAEKQLTVSDILREQKNLSVDPTKPVSIQTTIDTMRGAQQALDAARAQDEARAKTIANIHSIADGVRNGSKNVNELRLVLLPLSEAEKAELAKSDPSILLMAMRPRQ